MNQEALISNRSWKKKKKGEREANLTWQQLPVCRVRKLQHCRDHCFPCWTPSETVSDPTFTMYRLRQPCPAPAQIHAAEAKKGLWAPNCIPGTAVWRMRSISWCRWARHKGLDLARDGASAPWLVLPPCSPTHTLQEHLGRCHCTCCHGMRETKGAISLSL